MVACVPIWQQRPEVSPQILWEARHIELMRLDRWQIQGRTVITQGREAWNAGLRWLQDRDSFQIKILGPFAQGGLSLDGDKEQVVLTMADGQVLSSESAEDLITEVLDIQLPVEALKYWIRGIPETSKPVESIELDTKGQITHLLQQGWDIEFLRYVPFKQYSMPSKIFIKHPRLSVRLVITRWNSVE